MARGASTPERAVLAELMAPAPGRGLVALDSVRFGPWQPGPDGGPRSGRLEVSYRARHERERLAPEEREHRVQYSLTRDEDGRWRATARS
jgi:hypothetical protein